MSVEYFEFAEKSDQGKLRDDNEDAVLSLSEKGVYCVADGMGGAVGGDIASESITTTLKESFSRSTAEQSATFPVTVALFLKSVNQASRWIKHYSEEKNIQQMGSTVVGLIFDIRHPSRALVCHAGDSRLYRFRRGDLHLLTADHTAAAMLAMKLGRTSESLPAKLHSELVRAVGLNETVELEQRFLDVLSEDVFLLCTDGLTKMVPDSAIAKILKQASKKTATDLAQTLVDRANDAGGKDNISVIVVKVKNIAGLPPAAEDDFGDESKTVAAPESAEDAPTEIFVKKTSGEREPAWVSIDSRQGDTPETDDKPLDRDSPRTSDALNGPTPATKDRDASDEAQRTLGVLLAEPLASTEMPASSGASPPLQPPPTDLPPIRQSAHEVEIATPPQPARSDDLSPDSPVVAEAKASLPTMPAPYRPARPASALERMEATSPPAVRDKPAGQAADLVKRPVTEPGTAAGQRPRVPKAAVGKSLAEKAPAGDTSGSVGLPVPPAKPAQKQPARSSNSSTLRLLKQSIWGIIPLIAGLLIVSALRNRKSVEAVGNDPASDMGRPRPTPEVNTVDSQPHPAIPLVVPNPDSGRSTIESQPGGGDVFFLDSKVWVTPYEVSGLNPGKEAYFLGTATPTAIAVAVVEADLTNTNRVDLLRGMGTLVVTSEPTGATAWVDNRPLPLLPTNIEVEAGVPHTVISEFGAQRQTNVAVKVGRDAVELVHFAFQQAVSVQPSAERWTNSIGMVFVKLPESGAWFETARITLAQFRQIVGSALMGQFKAASEYRDEIADASNMVGLSFHDAKFVAEQLSDRAKDFGGFPPGCKAGKFFIPTTNQWYLAWSNANTLDIKIRDYKDYQEYCSRDESDLNELGAYAETALWGIPHSADLLSLQKNVAFRFVLVPVP